MKNLIFCLLFSCSFLFGTTAVLATELGGGAEVIIVAPKTGQPLLSFELPKDYQHNKGSVEITIREGKGNIVYSEVSNDLIIVLPPTLSGTLYVTVNLGELVLTRQITL